MAKGVLIAALDFANVAEDEFNDWYDLEHLPERQRVPGFLSCQRWIGVENAKHSVATYDLDSLAVLKSPPYQAIGGKNLSPWSKRVTAKCQRLLRFEGDQILPGDKAAPDNAGGLLLVGMTPAAGAETEFNAWYDTEHVPALGRVPGVLSARRLPAIRVARNMSPSTTSSRRKSSPDRTGSGPASRPRCRSTSGLRSATGCASSAETTAASDVRKSLD
jgi:hypothetical protein